jgi:hypothetical protein
MKVASFRRDLQTGLGMYHSVNCGKSSLSDTVGALAVPSGVLVSYYDSLIADCRSSRIESDLELVDVAFTAVRC